MAQNRSAAVMQQRAEPNDSLDDFPTPPWATRALCRWIAQYSSRRLGSLIVREPCANRGHMVRPLQEFFAKVYASDVHDYGLGYPIIDYLFPLPETPVDWTFINPPFRLGEEFIMRALDSSAEGVVVIARTAFLEGEDRYKMLFARHRPSHVIQFSERVCMLKGRLVRSNDPDPSEENPNRKAGTATAYCALVYFKHRPPGSTSFDWIGPCRRELEQPGDYPDDPYGLAELRRPLESFRS